MIFGLGFKDF